MHPVGFCRSAVALREVWIGCDEVWQGRRRNRESIAFDSHDGSFDGVLWFGSADAVLAALARSGWPRRATHLR